MRKKYIVSGFICQSNQQEIEIINKKVTKTPNGFLLAGDKTTENGTFEIEETKLDLLYRYSSKDLQLEKY